MIDSIAYEQSPLLMSQIAASGIATSLLCEHNLTVAVGGLDRAVERQDPVAIAACIRGVTMCINDMVASKIIEPDRAMSTGVALRASKAAAETSDWVEQLAGEDRLAPLFRAIIKARAARAS